jgi:diguanylate cyclase (GGDEF)-like protein
VAQRRLQRAKIPDALTGVFDRQDVIEQLGRQWAAVACGGQPLISVPTGAPTGVRTGLTCMLVDLDQFGRFNALQGYLAGDQALASTAAVLRETLPADSIIGRLCADQFMLVLPATAQAAAIEQAEQLRSAVERRFSADRNAPEAVALTLSIGIATRDDSVGDPDSLLRRAEEALQTARREGGNRVRTAAPASAARTARAARSGPPVLALVGPARS